MKSHGNKRINEFIGFISNFVAKECGLVGNQVFLINDALWWIIYFNTYH